MLFPLLHWLAVSALACRLCSAPSPVPLPMTGGQPFDARAEPGLLPDEKAELLGVYKEAGPYLSESPDGDETHLATHDEVTQRLKARALRLTAELREKEKKGTVTEADRKQALLLYWYRGPLLGDGDRAFLRSLNPAALGRAPPQPGKEGAVAGAGGAGAGGKAAPADIVQRLKAQLILEDNGDKTQAAELNLAVERMLESPTARKLAEELIKQGEKVRVRFYEVENSAVTKVDGRLVLAASGGNTDITVSPMVVTLNKDYLKTEAAYNAREIPDTLGHELLGHALENIKAKKAGVAETFAHYYNDEAGAGLVGWIITAERGYRVHDGHKDNILSDPAKYHAGLKVVLPYYAGTFTPAEMSNVLPVLQGRLKAVEDRKKKIQMNEIDLFVHWGKVADHFVGPLHKMPKSEFKDVYEKIDDQVKTIGPNRLKDMDAILKYVNDLSAYYKTPDGAKDLARMKNDSMKPFFAEQEKRVNDRIADLKKLEAGGTAVTELPRVVAGAPSGPASSGSPPPPAVLSWEDFVAMSKSDAQANPGHFK